jgi:hypothetical protein
VGCVHSLTNNQNWAFSQHIQLINCIRESVRSSLIPHKSSPDGSFQTLTSEAIENLTGPESFLTSDDYVITVIEDDPLLRAYLRAFLATLKYN